MNYSNYTLKNTNRIKIDPRIKLIHAILQGLLLFMVKSISGIVINLLFIIVILLFYNLYDKAIKTFLYGLILFIIVKLINFIGGFLLIFGITAYGLFKFSPIVGIYFILAETINVSDFITALEKIKFPRAMTITLAVTLRFLPTINQEVGHLKESMKTRNIPFTLLNFLKSPLMMLEYIIVPLMMRFVKVAEESAAAAVVRGIEKPGRRSSMNEIKIRWSDFLYLIVICGFTVFMYYFEKGVF